MAFSWLFARASVIELLERGGTGGLGHLGWGLQRLRGESGLCPWFGCWPPTISRFDVGGSTLIYYCLHPMPCTSSIPTAQQPASFSRVGCKAAGHLVAAFALARSER